MIKEGDKAYGGTNINWEEPAGQSQAPHLQNPDPSVLNVSERIILASKCQDCLR